MQQAMVSICWHLIEWVDNLVLDLAVSDLTILLAQYVVYKISASAIYITDLELMKSMLLYSTNSST